MGSMATGTVYAIGDLFLIYFKSQFHPSRELTHHFQFADPNTPHNTTQLSVLAHPRVDVFAVGAIFKTRAPFLTPINRLLCI